MSDRFLQLNLKFLQLFGFFFVCAFFKDLECVSEANTYIFFMQCAVAAFSVYVPEFEKYDKRYGDHDEWKTEKRYGDVDVNDIFVHFLHEKRNKYHKKNKLSFIN